MADEPTGLQPAADRIRETAKWLAVSLGALGTVLVAGSQLSSIGKLESGSDRLYYAIAGIAVAALGAIIILVATTWTTTTPAVSLNSVAAKTPLGTSKIVTDPTLLQGQGTVAALKTNYLEALDERSTTWNTWRSAPTDPAAENAFKAADSHAGFLNGIMIELLSTVSYGNLACRWRVAVVGIIIGGIIAAGGVGVFAWAANPPADVVASNATPLVLTTPQATTITLTAAGQESLKVKLGSGCKVDRPILGLQLGKTDAGPDLLTKAANGCKAIRFVLVKDWGTVAD